MSKKSQQRVDKLSRFLVYILGHRPDEFGLVPDKKGFLTYKELLWAIHEEEGWGYVRRSHIREVLLGRDRALFEADDEVIRVRERRWDWEPEQFCPSVPKLLFTPVRRRAHPHIMEKGLQSPEGSFLVFTSDKEMALRIGRRRDPEPVILEVMGHRAHRGDSRFFSFGQLFLIREIRADCIPGPAVPKESVKREGTGKQEKLKLPQSSDVGSFILDPERDPDPARRAGGKKHRGWKEDARKMRRRKNR